MGKAKAPALGWWGQRWLDYLAEELLLVPPSTSQVRGAERGAAALTFARGQVAARVEIGSFGDTHTATLKVRPLTDREWRRVLLVLAERPEAGHRLLSGAPGLELEEAFAAADAVLFPPIAGRSVKCTCWARWGCRHSRVLAVRSAAMLDANPFLWLQVLGRTREEIMAAVRDRLADRAGSEQRQPGAALVSAERFLSTQTDPGAIPVRPGHTTAPDALLRLLGPIGLPADLSGSRSADEVLSRYAVQISRGAADLAAGDRAPSYGDEALPGKRVSLRGRLAPEIAEALARAEGALCLADLHQASPTAAALPWEAARRTLKEALAELPEEYCVLAGRYVADPSLLLTGATLRHVITIRDWQNGRLMGGSDWEQVLAVMGCRAPYFLQMGSETCQVRDPKNWMPGRRHRDGLFALMEPEVGDELELTVADPDGPLLVGTLRRRAQRSPGENLETDREAVRALFRHMIEEGKDLIAEREAVEVLLGEGFYREGRCPDPVWLLAARAVGSGLAWGPNGTLTTTSWRTSGPSFGRRPYAHWPDRQSTLNRFTATMFEPGRTRQEIETVLTVVEAWSRYWPADQRDADQPPALAAVLHFLWNQAPLEARRLRIAPEAILAAMARWFGFLDGERKGGGSILRAHLEACGLVTAMADRGRTLPSGRGEGDEHEAWLMEGYRWIGRELCFDSGT